MATVPKQRNELDWSQKINSFNYWLFEARLEIYTFSSSCGFNFQLYKASCSHYFEHFQKEFQSKILKLSNLPWQQLKFWSEKDFKIVYIIFHEVKLYTLFMKYPPLDLPLDLITLTSKLPQRSWREVTLFLVLSTGSYLTELLFGFPCCISLGLIVLPSTTISRGSIFPCIVGLKSINSFGRFGSTENKNTECCK